MLLQEMLSKYSRQLQEVEGDIRYGLKHGHSKPVLLSKLKKKKLILHYMDQCRKKIDVILHKQYALEQLNITSMQIEAMKGTSQVFKRFTRIHSIEKIEELQGNIEDLQDQIMEINETIGTEPMMFDEEELEKELNELEVETPLPVSTVEFPVVPEEPVSIKEEKVCLLNSSSII